MMLGLNLEGFTKTEKKILDLLLDGRVHSMSEIISVCFDEFAISANVHPHIHHVRRKLVDKGLLLNFVVTNGRERVRGYQLSRRIDSSSL